MRHCEKHNHTYTKIKTYLNNYRKWRTRVSNKALLEKHCLVYTVWTIRGNPKQETIFALNFPNKRCVIFHCSTTHNNAIKPLVRLKPVNQSLQQSIYRQMKRIVDYLFNKEVVWSWNVRNIIIYMVIFCKC